MNTSKVKKITLVVFCSVLLFACQKILDNAPEISYDYYPIEEGKYRIYQVDSTVYDEYNCNSVTMSYQIMEVTSSLDVDGEGAAVSLVKRYFRNNSSENWVYNSTWTEKIEDNQLQRVEGSQRFIKLVFPVKESQTWDGLAYLKKDNLLPIRGGSIDVYKDWKDFEYQNVGDLYIDNSQSTPLAYPNTVVVLQADEENRIEKRYSKEVYAQNIGLVYKEMQILDTQCLNDQCMPGTGNLLNCELETWDIKAEKGFILIQSLIEHNY